MTIATLPKQVRAPDGIWGLLPRPSYSSFLRLVPLDTVGEFDTRASENIQSAANSQIHLAVASSLDRLEVFQASASSGVRHRDAAPQCQFLDQLLVYAFLQPFVVRGVDKKLRAVGLEPTYRLYLSVSLALVDVASRLEEMLWRERL